MVIFYVILDIVLVVLCLFSKSSLFSYVSIVSYIFIRFCIQSKSERKVYVDFCFVPIICVILIGYKDYQLSGSNFTSVAILRNASSFYSKVNYEDKKTLWEFLTPYIAACVGWVTFWAFWAQLKANEIASKDSKRTSVENTFFQMLAIHRENLNEIKVDNSDSKISALVIKKKIEGDIRQNIVERIFNPQNTQVIVTGKEAMILLAKKMKSKLDDNNKKAYTELYEDFYLKKEYFSSLATYFYHLYRMVKYIDSQEVLATSEKQDYMKNLRAQMSREEQTLLFHNWLAGYLLYDPKKGNEEYGYKWETKDQPFLSKYKLVIYLEPDFLGTKLREYFKSNFSLRLKNKIIYNDISDYILFTNKPNLPDQYIRNFISPFNHKNVLIESWHVKVFLKMNIYEILKFLIFGDKDEVRDSGEIKKINKISSTLKNVLFK